MQARSIWRASSIGGNIWMPIFVGTNGVLLGAMPIVAHLLGADKRDNIGKVIRHTIFLAIAFRQLSF